MFLKNSLVLISKMCRKVAQNKRSRLKKCDKSQQPINRDARPKPNNVVKQEKKRNSHQKKSLNFNAAKTQKPKSWKVTNTTRRKTSQEHSNCIKLLLNLTLPSYCITQIWLLFTLSRRISFLLLNSAISQLVKQEKVLTISWNYQKWLLAKLQLMKRMVSTS